jgi:hypothetical protein
MRWVIESGWSNGVYANNTTDHKFTFDPWCDARKSYCFATPGRTDTSTKVANVSPYNASSPYLADYEQWYAVVLKVVAGPNGSMEQYVNGVRTHAYTNVQTSTSSPQLKRIWLNSTLAQPQYNIRAHYRRLDYIIVTDSLADIQNAGLLSDPGSGGTVVDSTPPAAPVLHQAQ